MLVAGCITATICAGADAVFAVGRHEPHRRSVLLAWLFCALGVLAKGLIGIVLPGATLLIWIVWRRQWRALAALLWWPAVGLGLLIGAPWFILMQQVYPDFLHYFFVYQHFQRFAETGFNNVQPVWFYPAAIVLLTLPWSPGLWWVARRRTPVGTAGSGMTLLMLVWWLVIVGFFSIPRSKLIGYVLPSLPPLAALLAAAWRARFGDARVVLLAALSAALSLAAMVGVAVYDRKSAAPLVPTLEAQRKAGEPLVFVGRYVYDLPLLLREPAPVPVVTDWHDQAALHRDSWEKELADAAAFDPATASGVLVDVSGLAATLCQAPVTWVVVNDRPLPPELTGAQVLGRTRYLTLLRLDLTAPAARSALCGAGGRPTSG
jgi:hypothetical protein